MSVCPECGRLVDYDSYFRAHICTSCGWIKRVRPTVFECMNKSPERMAEVLADIVLMSVCDLMCGGECSAIDSFQQTKREACVSKILDFLNSEMKDE